MRARTERVRVIAHSIRSVVRSYALLSLRTAVYLSTTERVQASDDANCSARARAPFCPVPEACLQRLSPQKKTQIRRNTDRSQLTEGNIVFPAVFFCGASGGGVYHCGRGKNILSRKDAILRGDIYISESTAFCHRSGLYLS